MTGAPIHVLVTGAGGVYGEATVANLRRVSLGVRIFAADTRWHAPGSLLSDEPLVLPRVDDPSYLDRLVETVTRHRVRVVFICSGTEISALVERRDELEARAKTTIIMPGASLYRMASDKLDTVEFLARHGLDHPRTILSSSSNEELEAFIGAVGWPVIAKPRRGQGSRGVARCRSRADLEKFSASGEPYVFQEHLGDDDHEYTVGVVANEAGEVFGSIVLRRWLAGGQTQASEVVHSTLISEYAEAVARAAAPRGYINVQLRVHRGRPVCFEINARVSSSTGFRAVAGFNEPQMILQHYVLGERPPRPTPELIAMVRGLSVSVVDPAVWRRVAPPV